MQTLYVRPDGNDSNDGAADNAAHALLTPKYAIETKAVSGDTIRIAANSYSTAKIDGTGKNNVTLVGSGSGSCNLVQTGTGAVLDITGTTGWNISGINFDASSDVTAGWTIKADNTVGCTIDSCTGIGPEDGLIATGTKNLTVKGSTFHGYYDGMNISGSVNPVLRGSTFTTDSSIGIVVDTRGGVLDGCVDIIVDGCTFTNARTGVSSRRTVGLQIGGMTGRITNTTVNSSSSNASATGVVAGIDDFISGSISKYARVSGTTINTSSANANCAVWDVFSGLGILRDDGGNSYDSSKVLGPLRTASLSITDGWSILGTFGWTAPISGTVTGVLIAGGGASGSSNNGEGAGGGGARIDFSLDVVAGQVIEIGVGSGGSGSAGDYSYIADGPGWNVLGDSDSTTYFAGPGQRGSAQTGGAGGSDNGTSGTSHNGGAGGNGSSTDGGGGGGSGKSNAVGSTGNNGGSGGNAGGAGTGAGGKGGTTGVAGYPGIGPGAGAGGGGNGANGASGQPGQVLFSYIVPTLVSLDNGSVDTGVVIVDGTSRVVIDVTGHHGYLRLDLAAGGADLETLKITSSAVKNGFHQDWVVDFTTASGDMPFNNVGDGSPPLPAGSRRSIKLDMDGIAEIGLVATGTNTSLRAQCGSVPSP